MKRNSMNSSDVAKKINVSHTTITRILAGSIPTAITLYRLSLIFNVSMEYILLGEEIDKEVNYDINAAATNKSTCSDAHSELVEKYSLLTKDDQEEVLQLIYFKLNNSSIKLESDSQNINNDMEKNGNLISLNGITSTSKVEESILLRMYRMLPDEERIELHKSLISKITDITAKNEGKLSHSKGSENSSVIA